jgi:predicted lipoprotein with Yx(FWY)xxD motif
MAAAFVAIGIVIATPVAHAGSVAPVKVVDTAKGKALADDRGMTLYTFDKDIGLRSSCTGLCAIVWPPFKAASGITPSGCWSLVPRGGGTMQWAYCGRPLYTYANDWTPGHILGEGVEGTWHIARP